MIPAGANRRVIVRMLFLLILLLFLPGNNSIGNKKELNKKKFLKRIINNKQNVSFNDFVQLLNAFGFRLDRIKGSHHIFVHAEIKEFCHYRITEMLL